MFNPSYIISRMLLLIATALALQSEETLLTPTAGETVEAAALSPDGKGWFAIVASGKTRALVVNGRRIGAISPSTRDSDACGWSPDGASWAGIVIEPDQTEPSLLLKGKALARVPLRGDRTKWAFHPHSGQFWASADRGGPAGIELFLGEKSLGRFQSGGAMLTAEPPGGPGPLLLSASDGKECFVFTDGRRLGPFDKLESFVATNVSQKGWGFVGRRAKSVEVWINGTKHGPYDQTGPPLFDDAGRRHMFLAWKGDEALCVVDGKPHAGSDAVMWGGFSPDGTRWIGAVKRKQGWTVLVDGKEIDGPKGAYGSHATQLRIANSGRWIAIAEIDAKNTVVVDGKEVATVDEARNPVLSPDGSRWAVAVSRSGTWTILCDSGEIPLAVKEIAVLGSSWLAVGGPGGARRVALDGKLLDGVYARAEFLRPGWRHPNLPVGVFATREQETFIITEQGVFGPYPRPVESCSKSGSALLAQSGSIPDRWGVVLRSGKPAEAYPVASAVALSAGGAHSGGVLKDKNTTRLLFDGKEIAAVAGTPMGAPVVLDSRVIALVVRDGALLRVTAP